MRRAGKEEGFALTELLVAMAIFIVVISATLLVFDQFQLTNVRNQQRNDAQQAARTSLDQVARDLRNLASPTAGQPQAIDRATAYDLVFQNVDASGPNTGANTANVRRVRYCLDTTNPSAETLWAQIQTWTTASVPALPSTSSCPDPAAGWTGRQVMASKVVNEVGGQNRPVFAYNASTATAITAIRGTLYVDVNPGHKPGETTLGTGVFLRNQNRAPTSAFTATATGNRHVLLNGSLSSDPEGQPLTYKWYDGSTQVGAGITYDYQAPATGSRTFTLKVFDPANLEGDSQAQVVNVT